MVKLSRGPTDIRAVANDNGEPSGLSIDLRGLIIFSQYNLVLMDWWFVHEGLFLFYLIIA